MQKNNYSAGYANASGAVVIVVTRAGTNEFHFSKVQRQLIDPATGPPSHSHPEPAARLPDPDARRAGVHRPRRLDARSAPDFRPSFNTAQPHRRARDSDESRVRPIRVSFS